MTKITTRPDHINPIGHVKGVGVRLADRFQLFFDELTQKINDRLLGDGIVLKSYTVATLPDVPVASKPSLIYVSDETGGAVVAFSDGTNWRRVTDRAIVS